MTRPNITPSKNAISQAILALAPSITKRALFKLIRVPSCRTASARYWEQAYNILPWEKRSEAEKQAALDAARSALIAAGYQF